MSTPELRERIVRFLAERYAVNEPGINLSARRAVDMYHAFAGYQKGETDTLIEVGGKLVEVGSVLSMYNGDVRESLKNIVVTSCKISRTVFPYIDKHLYPIFFEGKSLEEAGIPAEAPPKSLLDESGEKDEHFGGETRTSDKR